MPAAVVNDSDGRAETQFDGALADGERVLRIRNAAADHRIDVHVKLGVFGQQLQLLVEYLQALLRNFVGIHVVDGDLQPLEARAVQALNAFRHQEISVGDQSGDHAVRANAADHVVEFGMQQRLAPGNRDHRRPQRAQFVDAAEHFVSRHWLRKIVELVAVGAGQIAAAHRNDVRQQRMIGRGEGAHRHGSSPQIAVQRLHSAAQGCNG